MITVANTASHLHFAHKILSVDKKQIQLLHTAVIQVFSTSYMMLSVNFWHVEIPMQGQKQLTWDCPLVSQRICWNYCPG